MRVQQKQITNKGAHTKSSAWRKEKDLSSQSKSTYMDLLKKRQQNTLKVKHEVCKVELESSISR